MLTKHDPKRIGKSPNQNTSRKAKIDVGIVNFATLFPHRRINISRKEAKKPSSKESCPPQKKYPHKNHKRKFLLKKSRNCLKIKRIVIQEHANLAAPWRV
jgi:hypothetical protein